MQYLGHTLKKVLALYPEFYSDWAFSFYLGCGGVSEIQVGFCGGQRVLRGGGGGLTLRRCLLWSLNKMVMV